MIVILYEDRMPPGTDPSSFGPHRLLVASIADALVDEGAFTNVWDARRQVMKVVIARTLNGSGNLMRICKEPSRELRGVRAGIAVYDFDHVVDLFPPAERGKLAGLCKRALRPHLHEPRDASGTPCGPLHVAFLDRNVESILRACDPGFTGKPTPIDRDRILSRVHACEDRAERDRVLVLVPSLKYIVDRVRQLAML